MTDTTNSLPNELLTHAAYIAWGETGTGDDPGMTEDVLRAALPILRDAIREQLVREMMAEFEGEDGLSIRTITEGTDGSFEFEFVTLDSRDALAYLRTYLPATEGGAE